MTFKTRVFVFVLPVMFAAVIHDSVFVFETFCLVGITLSVAVCYLIPLLQWKERSQKVDQMIKNFRDSIKLIYSGETRTVEDQNSAKYISILSNIQLGHDQIHDLFEPHGSDGLNCINQRLITLFNDQGNYSA